MYGKKASLRKQKEPPEMEEKSPQVKKTLPKVKERSPEVGRKITEIRSKKRKRGEESSLNDNNEATTSAPSTSTGKGHSKNVEIISLSGDSQTTEGSDVDSSSSPWTNSKDVASLQKKFKCPYCGVKYEKRHHLIKHIMMTCLSNPNSKTNTEAGKFKCTDCGRSYTHAKSLRYHQKHECNQRITCPDCGKTMLGQYVTERHKQKYCVKRQSKQIKRESPDELFIDDSSIDLD